MNEYDDKWEEKINALIDGELSALDADELKAEATDDRELARAIVEAYQLQQAMEQVRVEPAPASLRKKLKAIPREQREKKPLFGWMQPRWAAAFAVVPLLLVSISLMQPQTPSQEEIDQARQEMAIAFAYLDKAGLITSREIEANVGDKVAEVVTGSVSKTIKSQNIFSKESGA
jgi:anti-sigma factor RsiW